MGEFSYSDRFFGMEDVETQDDGDLSDDLDFANFPSSPSSPLLSFLSFPIAPSSPSAPPSSPSAPPSSPSAPPSSPSCPGITIITQPPEIWYQRGKKGQEFTIEANIPISGYTLELVYVPTAESPLEYDLARNTRKAGNGMSHEKKNDSQASEFHLTVRPKLTMCSRKYDRPFMLQLTLSTGHVVHSSVFEVHNRVHTENSFKPDAICVLKQLEWCTTGRCYICNQTSLNGHLSSCALFALLQRSN